MNFGCDSSELSILQVLGPFWASVARGRGSAIHMQIAIMSSTSIFASGVPVGTLGMIPSVVGYGVGGSSGEGLETWA